MEKKTLSHRQFTRERKRHTRNRGTQALILTHFAAFTVVVLLALSVRLTDSSLASLSIVPEHQLQTELKEANTCIMDRKFQKKKRVVRKWTAEEDAKVIELVKKYGTRRWSVIGSMLEGRNGKQCRER